MPIMAWWYHKTRTGWNTQWTSWPASPEGMALRPTSPSHVGWRAKPAYYGQGCQRRPKLWSARWWETCSGWDLEQGSHARSVELISSWGQWRRTADACTGWNPKSAGSGFWSVIRSTNLRCNIWDFRGLVSNAPAPSTVARGPPTHGMACNNTLSTITGSIGSRFWRKIPTPFPDASAVVAKYQQETKHPPLRIGEMRVTASHTRDLTTLIWGNQGLVSDKCGDTTTVGGFSIPRSDDCLQ